jgi:signal transduction histidine kinase/CheY-like chemotaxis protein
MTVETWAVRRGFAKRRNLRAGVKLNPTATALRAQADAATAERRLRDALDALPEGIVFLDAKGRYILWNKRYAELYRTSADLFRVGARLADTLRIGVARGDYPEAAGCEEAWLEERLARLAHPCGAHEQRLADGRWVLIEERKTGAGETIGLRVDITDLKQQSERLAQALEEAREASRAKSDFLANISHEIRTPLHGVAGLAQVLRRTPLNDEQQDLVSTIVSSAQDLNALLSDVLDLSRLEARKLELSLGPVSVSEIARECVSLFDSVARDKGLALELEFGNIGRDLVLADRMRVKQVLNNLLSNAMKFTAEGRVSLRLDQDAQQQTVFTVEDTGIGFEAATAERLFGRFEQANASTAGRYGGAGLGLAICRQLAACMGGCLTAVGEPGRGATFTLTLPLAPAEERAAQEGPYDAEPRLEALRVLVVDDNPINRRVLQMLLCDLVAAVDCVEDGQQAVEAVRQGVYDVVLMDHLMPVMNGLEATRLIAAQRGAPKVIMVSASASAEDHARSALAGAAAHLDKPIIIAELMAALAGVLRGEKDALEHEADLCLRIV